VKTRTRRRLAVAAAAGGALALGIGAAFAAAAGDNERVTRYWTRAEINSDGGAAITDVIDYAFGILGDHHGIDRFVPGLPQSAHVEVQSDAPHQVQLIPDNQSGREGTKIRIGDPDQTVSGRHRYRIDYSLDTLVRGNTVDWEALGTDTAVGVDEAEIHLLTPFRLENVQCSQGLAGSTTPCDSVKVVAPGHVMVTVHGLGPHEGVSIQGLKGAALATLPAVPKPPRGAPDNPGTGPGPPFAAGVGGGLVGALAAVVLVRRAGRERVVTGGVADVAYATAGAPPPPPGAELAPDPVREVRVYPSQLAQMATTEFAPPTGVRPAHGGIILDEEVQARHKVAWLIQAAIDGAIDMEDEDGTVVLTRRSGGDEEETTVLNRAFEGRDEIVLGQYDRQFANGWTVLGYRLEDWRDGSGLWDRRGDRRRLLAMIGGGILCVLAGVATLAAAAGAGRFGGEWLPVVAGAAVLSAAGLAAAVNAGELRVRTPEGSGLWLRVESFRRFLAESEAFHAEEAAKRGVLREYTAWAVAVGEIDRWSRAVSSSSVIPEDAGIQYAYLGPLLVYSTALAATAPSSSGGGGGSFGGGSVGGGGGGGGVGSW
jgi:Predicted membrane protein (DUF2207)